jgi:hypothetical protein
MAADNETTRAGRKAGLRRVNPVFVIPAVVKRYRYLFAGGKIMDVESPYRSDSSDREKVLDEAKRRWGGRKDDWRIEGVAVIDEEMVEGVTAPSKKKEGQRQ